MLKEAMLYRRDEGEKVSCYLCHHHCHIGESKFGICRVRQNIRGTLYTHSYGKVTAAHVDPIEKKPLYHFLPGSLAFSIGTPGCNFQCEFCQNWQISQAGDSLAQTSAGEGYPPEEIVRSARERGCATIAYTYTEPTIFFEYAYDVSRLAHADGIRNVFVTNGFMTGEALDTIAPYLDACNVDLKAFNDAFYRKVCHGKLQPVLDNIRGIHERGIWLEVTTLVVPGENDGEGELRGIAEFLAGIDVNIPWHISRFHPDYQFDQVGPTPVETLHLAQRMGKEAGLRFIYLGNVGGEPADTLCPACGEVLIQRRGYSTGSRLIDLNHCPSCRESLPGVF